MILDQMKILQIYHGKQRTKDGEVEKSKAKYHLSLFGNDVPYKDIWAYDESKDRYIPTWYNNQEGYINLSTDYDIPVLLPDRRTTLSGWMDEQGETYSCRGSVVRIKIIQKKGAVYPAALKVLEPGEPYDATAGL